MKNIVIHDVYICKNCMHKNILTNLHYNLFYLQKKIYQASKKCHLSLVQSLQKLLVSLYSIKILAHIKVQQKFKESEVIQNNIYLDNYSGYDLDLSIPIQKQIILWCLVPEWQPKIESSRMSQELNIAQDNSNYENNICSLKTEVLFTNISPKYIISKLQTIKWISDCIIKCFYKNSFVQVIHSQLSNFFRYDNLYIFIQRILFNGISWNLFRQAMPVIKKSINTINFFEYLKRRISFYKTDRFKLSIQQILLYLISDLNFTAQPIQYHKIWNIRHIHSKTRFIIANLPSWQNNLYTVYYNEFFYSLRDILSHKDRFGRVRTNTHISISMAFYKINKLINQNKSYSTLRVNNHTRQQVDKKIRRIVYRWAKKSCK